VKLKKYFLTSYKALLSIPKITNDEIINKYQESFSELSGVNY